MPGALGADSLLNPSYVSQLFSRFGQETVSATLLRLRMERAARLLTRSETKVAHVALESGYADVRTFHKAFRRYYRTTPAAYRAHFTQIAVPAGGPILAGGPSKNVPVSPGGPTSP